jgi:hypothetical protein
MTILRTDAERARWVAFVQAQPLPLEVEAKRYKRSRSSEQNRLLWAMYRPIADAMGFDLGDLHEWFCGQHWGWKDVRIPKTQRNPEGVASAPVRTTTRDENGRRSVCGVEDFGKLLDLVERTAAQVGVYVTREGLGDAE